MAAGSSPNGFWQHIAPSIRGPQFLLESAAARHIEGFLNQARLVLIGCVIVLANAGLLPTGGEDATFVLGAAGFVYAATVALLVHSFYRPWVAIAIALLDVVLVSGLVYLTGGPSSSLEMLYAIVMFAAIIRFTKVHSFLITAVVILSYVEVVSRHPAFAPEIHSDGLITHAIVLAAAGMLAWFVAVEVERQRRAVVETRQELASLATIERIARRLGATMDRQTAITVALEIAEETAGRAAALALAGADSVLALAAVGQRWRARRERSAGARGRVVWPGAPFRAGEADPVAAALLEDGFVAPESFALGSKGDAIGRLYVSGSARLRDAERALMQRLADDTATALQRIEMLEAERERASDMADLARQNGALLEQERDTVSRLRLLTSHKDSFIRLTAHELRTPLTSIRGFAQLLTRRSDDADSVYPRLILERSTRMGEIIDEIVDLSRMEQDLLQLDRQPTDLCELIRRVAKTAVERGGSVVVECAPLPPVRADADKLERALLMLVERASRDRTPNSTVLLSAERDDTEIQLWLAVEGALPTGGLGSIFDEVPDNAQEEHGGGLAVYIFKKMLEAHGGRMWLDRTASGGRYGLRLPIEGTTRLPRPATDERPDTTDLPSDQPRRDRLTA